MSALEKVQKALALAHNRLATDPDFPIYQSIVTQLEYMERVLLGTEDKSRMKDIIIGVYAAKEFEDSDPEFADVLHYAYDIADKITRGLKVT